MPALHQQSVPVDPVRESFKDAIVVIQKLSNHCKTFEDMIAILQLALDNDSQYEFVVSVMQGRR